jgi:hypothetical protein
VFLLECRVLVRFVDLLGVWVLYYVVKAFFHVVCRIHWDGAVVSMMQRFHGKFLLYGGQFFSLTSWVTER